MSVVCRITTVRGICEYTDLDDAWAEIARAALRNDATLFLGVVGSRRRNSNNDAEIVRRNIQAIHDDCPDFGKLVIVSGACPRGADNFAANHAKQHRLPLIEFPAQWDLYGKRAGFVRNEYIARLSNRVLAIVADDRTGGTEDTIKHAERLGRKVILA